METRLPYYRSHKTVRAAKILKVEPNRVETEYGFVDTPDGFAARSAPAEGDYVIVYEDGYVSHSPADAFEGGYNRLS